MKKSHYFIGAFVLASALFVFSSLKRENATDESSLRQVLLEQLKTTHSKKDWFVPANVAVDGLTPQQAMWTDQSGNHSVGQLAKHLIFWNARELSKVKGQKSAAFSGNNEETFGNQFDDKSWPETLKALDQVMSDWENFVQTAEDSKLKEAAGTIANVSTHNAYHVAQMVFVRKQQGVWDAAKGVK